MTPPIIGVCLSTGRAGTMYLEAVLVQTYGDVATIRHEDIKDRQSKPNEYLWLYDSEDVERIGRDRDVAAYLEHVDRSATDQPYIDVGHGNVPLLPLLIERFPDRIRLLHLVRDPVLVSASNVTMGQYCPDAASTVGENVGLPHPGQPRCAHPEFAEQWNVMTPFEKNLWRWAEYNAFGVELHRRYPSVPYLLVPAQKMFGNAEQIREIARFYELADRDPALPRKEVNAANPNLTTMHSVGDEWRRYVDYPHVLELAEQLGAPVKLDGLDVRMRKYAKPTPAELRRFRWRQRLTVHWLVSKLRALFRQTTSRNT